MQNNHRNGYYLVNVKKEDKIKISSITVAIILVIMSIILYFMCKALVNELSNFKFIQNKIDKDAKIEFNVEAPEKIQFVKENKKVISLTFDDGPGKYTKELVDFLVENDVSSTFFMIGQNIELYPNNVKYAYDNGMEIGNHTYDHKNLKKLDEEEIQEQINKVDEKLENIIGTKSRLYRPPGGNKNDLVLSTINKPCIIWNVDTIDWKVRDKDKIIDTVLEKVDDGDIILFHEIYPTTIEAIKVLVPKLKKMGYEMVTVSKLYELKGISLESGKVYYGT